ncbi:hypothetical protein A2U01_0055466, partial [Trifolium medium]|nr:hypothetical protein [Trifolium medium]
ASAFTGGVVGGSGNSFLSELPSISEVTFRYSSLSEAKIQNALGVL